MKKNLLFLISFFLLFVSANAQPQKVVADKIVAVVGDKIILKSDVDNTIGDMKRQGIDIPANAECLTLEQAMGVKALVLQAEKDSLPITDEEVEADIDNQIRYFISAYGSKEELEKVSGKSIYQLKEDFKEGFRDRKLASAMRNKIVENVRITPNEVKEYFETLPKDSLAFYESELEVGQIVLFPKPNRDAEEYSIEQLKDFKKQIESGRKDFKMLASLYSMDPGSKDNAGQYEINRNEKQWDPAFIAKAFSLKEGQVSNPFKSKFGYHIVQLVSRLGDDAVVRHILLIPKVTQVELRDARSKLDSVRAKLITGGLQFGQAVDKYSEDESSKFTGGIMQNAEGSTSLTIDQMDKDLVVMMKDLRVGEYSQPTEFTNERGRSGIRIVYLRSRTEPHRENLKDDYDKIAQRALEEKKGDALDKWFAKKIPSYYIKVDDVYKNCEELHKWTQGNVAGN